VIHCFLRPEQKPPFIQFTLLEQPATQAIAAGAGFILLWTDFAARRQAQPPGTTPCRNNRCASTLIESRKQHFRQDFLMVSSAVLQAELQLCSPDCS
jgi:hypothetical protein